MRILKSAREIADFLEARHISYAFIDGLALQYWGEPRLTSDIDVTVLVSNEVLEEFVNVVLKHFRARIKDANSFALKNYMLLIESTEKVPINISLGIPGYEQEALQRAVLVKFLEVGMLKLLSPEDFIIHKCVAGRPRDIEDVEGILLRQTFELDTELIRRWLTAFREVMESHDPLHIFDTALKNAKKLMEGGQSF